MTDQSRQKTENQSWTSADEVAILDTIDKWVENEGPRASCAAALL